MKNIYVTKTSIPLLEDLTKATRNVLQCISLRVAKKYIPTIFNHNITSCDKKDRISQEYINHSALLLLNIMNKYQHSFLSNPQWLSYNNLLQKLYATSVLFTTGIKKHVRK